MSVDIIGAKGFVDYFRATLIPGLHEIPTDVEPVSVVHTEAGEYLAIPSKYVRFVEDTL